MVRNWKDLLQDTRHRIFQKSEPKNKYKTTKTNKPNNSRKNKNITQPK